MKLHFFKHTAILQDTFMEREIIQKRFEGFQKAEKRAQGLADKNQRRTAGYPFGRV